jgi:hypothetical protein
VRELEEVTLAARLGVPVPVPEEVTLAVRLGVPVREPVGRAAALHGWQLACEPLKNPYVPVAQPLQFVKRGWEKSGHVRSSQSFAGSSTVASSGAVLPALHSA